MTFKIGDIVRLKDDELAYQTYGKERFKVTGISSYVGGSEKKIYKLIGLNTKTVKEWYGFRLIKCDIIKSHYPAWF
jgi:hypothetical protein